MFYGPSQTYLPQKPLRSFACSLCLCDVFKVETAVEAVADFVVKGFGQWTQINRAAFALLDVIIFMSYRGRSVAQKGESQ